MPKSVFRSRAETKSKSKPPKRKSFDRNHDASQIARADGAPLAGLARLPLRAGSSRCGSTLAGRQLHAMKAIRNVIAMRKYASDAKLLERPALDRLSGVSRRLLEEAQSQARALDDNHVGTEHIMLAIYALGARAATKALESLGVTHGLFAAQLFEEPGPSPSGGIPLTPRSRMIVALAGVAATRMGSEPVEPEHILLGVIRESGRWEAAGMGGPHHLRDAAAAAGTTLGAIEQNLIREMRSNND
jgi:hypothetical protein